MSDTPHTVPGPAEEADQEQRTTDADRTATAEPGGALDEASEDEEIEGDLVDRALKEPPG